MTPGKETRAVVCPRAVRDLGKGSSSMRRIGRRTAGQAAGLGVAALTVVAAGFGTTLATVGAANGAPAGGFERQGATNGDAARAALAAVKEHRSAVHGGAAQVFTVKSVLVDP